MEDGRDIGSRIDVPVTAADKNSDVKQDSLSPITSDEVSSESTSDSSFDEGNSGESGDGGSGEDGDGDSGESDNGNGGNGGSHTSSAPNAATFDRDGATQEIFGVLNRWPEVSVVLQDWARMFIEEEPQMLTRSSTIVDAHGDRERAHAELRRGIGAICRIFSDQRLGVLRDWALRVENEWQNALVMGNDEVRYHDFIDLMYSAAVEITEQGEGERRKWSDLHIVQDVFGFLKQETEQDEGDDEEEDDKE